MLRGALVKEAMLFLAPKPMPELLMNKGGVGSPDSGQEKPEKDVGRQAGEGVKEMKTKFPEPQKGGG